MPKMGPRVMCRLMAHGKYKIEGGFPVKFCGVFCSLDFPCLFSPWPYSFVILCRSKSFVISATPPDASAFGPSSGAGRHLENTERAQSECQTADFLCLFIFSKPEAFKEIFLQLFRRSPCGFSCFGCEQSSYFRQGVYALKLNQ